MKRGKLNKPKARAATKNDYGSSMVESILIGALVLLPIVAFFLDAAVLIGANMANQSLADSAARAAGSYPDPGSARKALDYTISRFPRSALIPSVNLDEFAYFSPSDAGVMVGTSMNVNLPIPIPGIQSPLILKSKSWQPNTALRPGSQVCRPPADMGSSFYFGTRTRGGAIGCEA